MARQVKRLGDMLVEAGLLSTENLKKALLEHKKANVKLGEYLVREGVIRESQITEVISQQLNIEQYHPNKYPFEVQLASLITTDFARMNKVAPLRRRGNLLTVAMVDPLDITTLDDLEIMTNLEVEPVICSDRELTELIYSIYGVGSQVDDSISKMEDDEMYGSQEEENESVSLSSLEDMAGEAPVIRLVNTILSQAARSGASDIHISPEKSTVHLRYRVDGKLREVPAPPRAFFAAMASRLKILAGMDISVTRIPQDGRFSFNMDNQEIHVRVSSLPTIHGENMVLRLLHRSGEVMTLEDLGFSEEDKAKIEAAVIKPYGMLLATGPTGSGKSTTLYALLKKINQPDINIITLEDPVEFRVEKIRQAQLNRKAGMTFASGLRSILRQDPDVVMVGEIRDAETANIAVQAALTGHRLLSTLHTNDAAGAVTRLMEMDVQPFLVASTLLVAVAQRLVRKICSKCKEEYAPPKPMLKALGLDQDPGPFYRGAGCARCGQQGYSGRVGIYEVLLVDDDVQDMILRRESPRQITKNLVQAGKLRTLRQGAADKVRLGLTTAEEAMSTVMV
ncbi:GspE/PulE family protein [Desulfonatronum sp. SC1]|uniref:GspE/PulE family protein n=1 Tax=Desulfonatronum sp. SC1 TaxID=2109626 RepID=UPI000D32287A|nr:GspE/PulE family protein [Desulfonatronum sp. SC1]PTN37523.1 general secretion pathway protein GspE [Desulfonatronum sp. SC1]